MMGLPLATDVVRNLVFESSSKRMRKKPPLRRKPSRIKSLEILSPPLQREASKPSVPTLSSLNLKKRKNIKKKHLKAKKKKPRVPVFKKKPSIQPRSLRPSSARQQRTAILEQLSYMKQTEQASDEYNEMKTAISIPYHYDRRPMFMASAPIRQKANFTEVSYENSVEVVQPHEEKVLQNVETTLELMDEAMISQQDSQFQFDLMNAGSSVFNMIEYDSSNPNTPKSSLAQEFTSISKQGSIDLLDKLPIVESDDENLSSVEFYSDDDLCFAPKSLLNYTDNTAFGSAVQSQYVSDASSVDNINVDAVPRLDFSVIDFMSSKAKTTREGSNKYVIREMRGFSEFDEVFFDRNSTHLKTSRRHRIRLAKPKTTRVTSQDVEEIRRYLLQMNKLYGVNQSTTKSHDIFFEDDMRLIKETSIVRALIGIYKRRHFLPNDPKTENMLQVLSQDRRFQDNTTDNVLDNVNDMIWFDEHEGVRDPVVESPNNRNELLIGDLSKELSFEPAVRRFLSYFISNKDFTPRYEEVEHARKLKEELLSDQPKIHITLTPVRKEQDQELNPEPKPEEVNEEEEVREPEEESVEVIEEIEPVHDLHVSVIDIDDDIGVYATEEQRILNSPRSPRMSPSHSRLHSRNASRIQSGQSRQRSRTRNRDQSRAAGSVLSLVSSSQNSHLIPDVERSYSLIFTTLNGIFFENFCLNSPLQTKNSERFIHCTYDLMELLQKPMFRVLDGVHTYKFFYWFRNLLALRQWYHATDRITTWRQLENPQTPIFLVYAPDCREHPKHCLKLACSRLGNFKILPVETNQIGWNVMFLWGVSVTKYMDKFTDYVQEGIYGTAHASKTPKELLFGILDLHFMTFFQRVSAIPNNRFLISKALLYTTMTKYHRFDKNKFLNVMPPTFTLPKQFPAFHDYAQKYPDAVFILKRLGASRGRDISIVTDFRTQIVALKHNHIIQEYIRNPWLIQGKKFDFRIYFLVSSVEPMQVYIYREGFARFCCEPYAAETTTDFIDIVRHLTNTGIQLPYYRDNDHRSEVKLPFHESITFAHNHPTKVSLQSFKEMLKYMFDNPGSTNIDLNPYSDSEALFDVIWHRIRTIITKTMTVMRSKLMGGLKNLSNHYNARMKAFTKKPIYPFDDDFTPRFPFSNCFFEVFGADILFDDQLKPYLLEVNTGPSLEIDTSLDEEVKSRLLGDTLRTIKPIWYSREQMLAMLSDILTTNNFKLIPQRLDDKISHLFFQPIDEVLSQETEAFGNYEVLIPSEQAEKARKIVNGLHKKQQKSLSKRRTVDDFRNNHGYH
ncbi:hypothetical protein PCE1_003014 [Barthelona sp. PCE]